MTREQVAALAAGKDDVELIQEARKFGLLPLTCDFDGVDIAAEPHSSQQFSRDNPFVHLAIRENYVKAVQVDISEKRMFQGKPVFESSDEAGQPLPIMHTLFKGETV